MGRAGQFETTVEDMRLAAEAASLRSSGLSYESIAQRQGCSISTAHSRVQRALKAVVQEAGSELRDLELQRLDLLWRVAQGEMLREHPVVNQGRVIRGEDGEPLKDAMPRLAALNALLKIQDRRAKLMGLDAAVKADVRVSNGVDRSIEQFAAEFGIMAELAAAAEAPALEGGRAEAP